MKNQITLPEKGWIKKNMDALTDKMEGWKTSWDLEDFSDGDPTTSIAEGTNFIYLKEVYILLQLLLKSLHYFYYFTFELIAIKLVTLC